MSVEMFLTIAGIVVTAIGLIITGFWAVSKLAMSQFDRRLEERFKGFAHQIQELRAVGEARLLKLEGKQDQIDADVRRILIELPRDYVARTDYIRRETVMEAKIDQLGLRIENWMLKGERQ